MRANVRNEKRRSRFESGGSSSSASKNPLTGSERSGHGEDGNFLPRDEVGYVNVPGRAVIRLTLLEQHRWDRIPNLDFLHGGYCR